MSRPFERMEELDRSPRGLRLRVCAWGPPTGVPVVCCHGWLDQGAAFDRVAEGLVASGFRVYAPDHRGHGHSEWTPPGTTYHFMEYVADLDGLIGELGLERVILVGHSMGGTIASLYAGLRPERVAGLVLLDGLGPPAVTDDDAADQARAFLEGSGEGRSALRPHRPIPTVEAGAERIRRTNEGLTEAFSVALARRVLQPVGGGFVWRWDPLHRTRAAVAYDVDRHRAILRRIACPVALGIGGQGWYRQLRRLEARVGDLKHLVERQKFACGHDVHHAEVSGVVALVERVFHASKGGAPPHG